MSSLLTFFGFRFSCFQTAPSLRWRTDSGERSRTPITTPCFLAMRLKSSTSFGVMPHRRRSSSRLSALPALIPRSDFAGPRARYAVRSFADSSAAFAPMVADALPEAISMATSAVSPPACRPRARHAAGSFGSL